MIKRKQFKEFGKTTMNIYPRSTFLTFSHLTNHILRFNIKGNLFVL